MIKSDYFSVKIRGVDYMNVELGIDTRTQTVSIEDARLVGIAEQNEFSVSTTGADAVVAALASPIGTPKLQSLVKPGDRIAIITSDLTRPCPSSVILPPILEELRTAGCKPEDITIVFALGGHRTQTEAEKRKLVGDSIYDQYNCVDSDSNDVIHMGETRSGTPVDITRSVAEADFRIGVGNIEYHYFAGYSGGAKAIMPGSSTWEAIQANHRMMVRPEACAGNLIGNPVRDDLEEAIEHCSLDFIVNVVLDEHKKLIYAVAGHFIDAHRVGCKFLDGIYSIPLKEKADIVIVSQGGAPKDLNLYQTQKALDNSKYAIKDGGIIILVGSCKEGLGEETFSEWMESASEPADLVRRIHEDFQLGGHKAAAIAMVMEKAKIYMVSDMPDELVRSIFMEPFHTVQEALDAATRELGRDSTVYVMPHGGSTLPVLQD